LVDEGEDFGRITSLLWLFSASFDRLGWKRHFWERVEVI
jgi:hypothetical protein